MDTSLYCFNLPGRIVSFDETNQTANVQVCVEHIAHSSEDVQTSVGREPLEGIPVHVLGGGGWHITMPIKVGDTCILFFSQVGYDHWFYEDKDTAGKLAGLPKPWLKRKFHEDDGYALVGLNTLPRAIASYDPVNSQWRNNDATQVISLNADDSISIDSTVKVKVTAPLLEIISPSVTMSGNLGVTGTVTGGSGVFGGIVSESHTHTGDSGGSTSAPN